MKAKNLIESIASAQTLEEAKKLANQFLIANSAGLSNKLDLYKFCGKDTLHPVTHGIYFDPEGYRVATNNYVLLATKKGFKSEFSGKIISNDGNNIEGIFPSWCRILPDISNSIKIDLMGLDDVITQYKIDKKVSPKKLFALELSENYFIEASKLELLRSASIELESNILHIFSGSHFGRITSEYGEFLIYSELILEDNNIKIYKL